MSNERSTGGETGTGSTSGNDGGQGDAHGGENDSLIRVLAWTSREFDEVRDRLVGTDEPGPDEVDGGLSPEPLTPQSDVADNETAPHGSDGEDDGVLASVKSAVSGVTSKAADAADAVRRAVVGSVHPAHEDWSETDIDTRIDWWVERLGTAAAALASLPSFGGAFVRATGLGDALGGAGQVLIVNAVAQELGITDPARHVVESARIVLGRELDIDEVRRVLDQGEDLPEHQALEQEAQVLEDEAPSRLERLGSTALLLRRVARQFRQIGDDLDKRPQGGWFLNAVANLPAVGAAAGFLAERSGVRTAAETAAESFNSTAR